MEIRSSPHHLIIILPGHETPEGQPTDTGQAIAASWDALASWSVLLGIDSVGEVMACILKSADKPQDVDAEGRNPWTISYEALEASLNDTVPQTLSLDSREATLNDPLTAARQQTLAALGITRPRQRSMLSTATPINGFDINAIDQQMQDTNLSTYLEQAQERFYESLMPPEPPKTEQ